MTGLRFRIVRFPQLAIAEGQESLSDKDDHCYPCGPQIFKSNGYIYTVRMGTLDDDDLEWLNERDVDWRSCCGDPWLVFFKDAAVAMAFYLRYGEGGAGFGLLS